MPESRLEQVIAKLRARGKRITPQRIAILKVLLASAEHPGVERVYELVRRDLPTTSIAAVYKTVQMLKEAGEVLELEFGDGNRYDGRHTAPHAHLVCVKCRSIVDPELPGLGDDLKERIAADTGYRIVNHRLDFFGVCPQCQKQE